MIAGKAEIPWLTCDGENRVLAAIFSTAECAKTCVKWLLRLLLAKGRIAFDDRWFNEANRHGQVARQCAIGTAGSCSGSDWILLVNPSNSTAASSSSNFVEIDNVNFAYGKRPILKGISLNVPKGKVIAIMGGSGCGKTTLLQLIGGQLKASSGRVVVNGQDIATLDREGLYALRRKMGMLFQFGALFTDMSVFDNIAFQIREHADLPEDMIHDLVLMKLHAVGLRGTAHLSPSELSGGMARRVALARAVALDPELIMYDEPFAGLDPISLAVVGKTIRRLNDALGATSIVVTHDIMESLQIVDYLYFISDGQIVGHGTPDEIRASTEPFIKQFVHAELDGPVPFHYPAANYADELGIARAAKQPLEKRVSP